MSQPAHPLPRVLLCLLFALAAGSRALAGDQDWKPVDPAQLAMKAPVVEPSADAEAIFWEVRADDGGEQDFVLSHYIRIKIFTERGRESQSKVELPYFGDVRIKDVAARTIKPDGSVVELKKEDIFDKTIVRQGDRKLRAKTFALQGVEPGSIIEYRWREVHPNSSRTEYAGLVERWITRGATGAKVSKVEPADDREAGRFALDVDFTAASYGQLMQGRLLVFKPAIVSRREFLDFTGGARKHPVVLESHAFNETVSVKLPAGFDVDELPDAVKLDAPFGNYSASYEVKDGQLRFNRSFVQRAATIPAEQYAQVRGFFERIRAAEQSPVVLAKK